MHHIDPCNFKIGTLLIFTNLTSSNLQSSHFFSFPLLQVVRDKNSSSVPNVLESFQPCNTSHLARVKQFMSASAPPASLGTTELIEAHYCHRVLVSIWSGLKKHLPCVHQHPERLLSAVPLDQIRAVVLKLVCASACVCDRDRERENLSDYFVRLYGYKPENYRCSEIRAKM